MLMALMATTMFVTSFAQAEIKCVGNTDNALNGTKGLPVEVRIDQKTKEVHLKVGDTEKVLTTSNEVWDGHSAGLITGEGFSFIYQNWYGCIHNAELMAQLPHNFGKVSFKQCLAGTDMDELCFRN